MRSAVRLRVATLAMSACVGATFWVTSAGAQVSKDNTSRVAHTAKVWPKRFNLRGYVLDARYTKGRNTGNTFRQHYRAKTVRGVPIAGPYVGTKFPREAYVAMPIGHHELYVAWLKRNSKHPLLDVFVMNFKTHKIWDYAPGSLKPESIGTVTIHKKGAHRLP